jgi:hypothetical protein
LHSSCLSSEFYGLLFRSNCGESNSIAHSEQGFLLLKVEKIPR